MRDNSNVVLNWNYVTLSLVVFVVITLMILYMPGMREIDTEILKSIRRFLGQFPSYIPVFFLVPLQLKSNSFLKGRFAFFVSYILTWYSCLERNIVRSKSIPMWK